MGDHLALLVDRLLTESTLEATIESRKRAQNALRSESPAVPKVDVNEEGVGKVVECRICQEDDEGSNMESPCSCSGSLKYAHRKCVQRWCNEKGDTMCEICLQQFEPGYTAPPPLFHYGSIPMNFRGSWEISSRDFRDSQIITMVPSDRGVMGSSDDEYNSFSTTRRTVCCRAVAIIFTTLLVLRNYLPLMLSGDEDYSLTLFSLLLLRTAGILVPMMVIARVLTMFHRRRRQQVGRNIPISGLDEESARSRPIYQSQPHLVGSH